MRKIPPATETVKSTGKARINKNTASRLKTKAESPTMSLRKPTTRANTRAKGARRILKISRKITHHSFLVIRSLVCQALAKCDFEKIKRQEAAFPGT